MSFISNTGKKTAEELLKRPYSTESRKGERVRNSQLLSSGCCCQIPQGTALMGQGPNKRKHVELTTESRG